MKEQYLTHVYEAMNALTSGFMPDIDDKQSVYIVNYMQNNAFAQAVTTDYKFRHGITRDPKDKKLKLIDVDNQDEYGFDNSTDIKGAYRVLDKAKLSEGLEKLYSNIGNAVEEGFIYECILGDKMYTWDQIEFTDKVEKVIPFEDIMKGMNESIRNYTLYGKEKAELIAEVKYGNKDVSTIMEDYRDILLEFDFKESIKNIISKIKLAIYNLLSRLEKAVNNLKDSGLKSIVLKAISKLKSLFKSCDNINSIDEANNISKEVENIKEELSKDSKMIYDEAIRENKILRITIMLKDSILLGTIDQTLEYLKQKDYDIFEKAKEIYPNPKSIDIPEDLSKLSEKELFDELNLALVILVENFTRDNVEKCKKLEREYNKRLKSTNESVVLESSLTTTMKEINKKIHNCITDEYKWYFIHIYELSFKLSPIFNVPETCIQVIGFKDKIDPKYKDMNLDLGAIISHNPNNCKILLDDLKIKGRIYVNEHIDKDLRKYTHFNSIFKKVVKESSILDESKLFNVKDIYYNRDKFNSGEINLCFITGFSGSGKSSMANDLDGLNIELDDIIENCKFSDKQLKELGDPVYKFFTTIGKEFRLKENSDISDLGAYAHRLTKEFCKFIMFYSDTYKQKIIVNGVQLYSTLTPTDLPFANYAVFIKGTSKLHSSVRATKRDTNNDKANGDKVTLLDRLHMFTKQFTNDKEDLKNFNEWYYYFKDLL